MLLLTRKRSFWASGSGKVPSCSTGFCVAITKNGSGSMRVSPSVVTCPSSIASSSAAWVLGEARLISSASTMFAKTGPGWNSNSRAFSLKTWVPVTSAGRRSGVNWIREKESPRAVAKLRAVRVFPVPGTSSRRT